MLRRIIFIHSCITKFGDVTMWGGYFVEAGAAPEAAAAFAAVGTGEGQLEPPTLGAAGELRATHPREPAHAPHHAEGPRGAPARPRGLKGGLWTACRFRKSVWAAMLTVAVGMPTGLEHLSLIHI